MSNVREQPRDRDVQELKALAPKFGRGCRSKAKGKPCG